jgi:hypothetical protein
MVEEVATCQSAAVAYPIAGDANEFASPVSSRSSSG